MNLLLKANVRQTLNANSIDSLHQPKVTAGRDHCCQSVCPYVRTSGPTFQI